MTRVMVLVLLGAVCLTGWGYEQATDPETGAVNRIYMPEEGEWNGALVVYAHGYVPPIYPEPVIPEEQLALPDGTGIPGLVTGLGYAFAVTSYRTNGLAVRYGVDDLLRLAAYFTRQHEAPTRIYVVGASEGGLIAALAVEQWPDIFDGGVASCGPVGSFRQQLNYVGDFRVVFDYFFPRVIPGSPVNIPAEVMANWETVYAPRVLMALQLNPNAARQLLRVTGVPVDSSDPDTLGESVVDLLQYNVVATNDAVDKLGGQPFDNMDRRYRGSTDDMRLNRQVERFRADPMALAEMRAHYETSGAPAVPLITLHTTGDPIVPYWQEQLYSQKAMLTGCADQLVNRAVARYGHCNFRAEEVLDAFEALVEQDEARVPW